MRLLSDKFTRKILIVAIVTLFVLLSGKTGTSASENNILAQPAENAAGILSESATPLQATLSIAEYPPLGQPTTLTCEISSSLDAAGTSAQIELPDNVRLLEGSLDWQGDLMANAPVKLTATIVFDTEGETAVFCRVLRVIDEQNRWGDLAALYLTIGQTKSQVGFLTAPPQERDVLGEMAEAGEGQIIDQSPTQPAPSRDTQSSEPSFSAVPTSPDDTAAPHHADEASPQGNLTINGRWRFHNREDILTSEQMLVEIVRGDNSNHLAWCYTDVNGYYSCGPFTNPGAAGVRSRFLSYTSFVNNILVTVNPDWGTVGNAANAFGTTTPVQVFADGTRDIGSWQVNNGSNYERAYWITHDLIRVWKYIWFGAGSSQSPQETTGPATVEWKIDSTDGTYYSRGGNIHLDGTDPLSNTVVGHEYGHNIMYTIYGNWMPTTYCPSPHYIQRISHVNCAWTEGWANFLTIAVNNDPVYRWDSGASLNLENPTWGTSNWDNGDAVEGRIAGALWDILDTANENDDQYSDGGIANIWDTIYHQNDNNFSEYFTAWKARGHNNSSAGPVMAIYQNTINYRSGPVNDDFANATNINSIPYLVSNYNTANATTQGNDPESPCGSSSTRKQSRSVWYRFTPATTGNYAIDTFGSNYDTVLAVWTGVFGALTNRGCNDDSAGGLQSSLTVQLNSGTTYYIEVMRYGSSNGGLLTLNLKRNEVKVFLPSIIK